MKMGVKITAVVLYTVLFCLVSWYLLAFHASTLSVGRTTVCYLL